MRYNIQTLCATFFAKDFLKFSQDVNRVSKGKIFPESLRRLAKDRRDERVKCAAQEAVVK